MKARTVLYMPHHPCAIAVICHLGSPYNTFASIKTSGTQFAL